MFDNTVGILTDVPVAIRSYYQEEVRSESTGNTITEEYTYIDEDGNEQTATREVPEMQDVTYIMLKDFGSTDGNPAMQMRRQAKHELIELHLSRVNAGINKAFHDSYLAWLESPAERARDEHGAFIADDADTPENEAWANGYTPEMHANDEPVLPDYKFADDYPEWRRWAMLHGVGFEGVMCSATKYDFYGLSAAEAWVREGNSTTWNFDNGNQLVLTPNNIDAFYNVWLPFRLSFFE